MGEQLVSVEKMVKKINEMEDQGQIVRPVANALRREMGAEHEERPEEQFKLDEDSPSPAMIVEAGPKATKKQLTDALGAANVWIKALLKERNDVRRAAEHFMGFQNAAHYSAGYLFVLLANMHNQDMQKARQTVGKFFGLDELHTDNLSNDPELIAAEVLHRYKVFWKDIAEARNLLGFIVDEISANEGLTCQSLGVLNTANKLIKNRLNHHFAPGVNPAD